MKVMTYKWLYESDNVAPGESWYDVLRRRGDAGWEAWHMEKDERGWRTIYFKQVANGDKAVSEPCATTFETSDPQDPAKGSAMSEEDRARRVEEEAIREQHDYRGWAAARAIARAFRSGRRHPSDPQKP